MKLRKLPNLNQKGFSLHFIMPVLAIAAVVGIGAVTVFASHAATPTCRAFNFSQGGHPVSGVSASSGVSNAQCIYDIQAIVNGAYEQNSGSYTNVARTYDTYYGGTNGEIGGVSPTDNNYNLLTVIRVKAFQATFNYSDQASGGKYEPLNVNGTVDADTWSALCGLAGGWKSKTGSANIWAEKAYAVYTAAATGCQNGFGGAVQQRSTPVPPGSSVSPAPTTPPATTTTKTTTKTTTTTGKGSSTTGTTTSATGTTNCSVLGGFGA